MGFFSDAGKFVSENPPIRQRAYEPDDYDFNVRNEDDIPAFQNNPDGQFGGWLEQIDNETPSTYETSARFAHATLYAFIPNDPNTFYRFENAVLGWHVTAEDFSHIQRTNPIQHPRKRNLYAYKISEARGRRFDGREDMPTNILGNPGAFAVSGPENFRGKGPKAYAEYNHMLVAVEFKPNPTGFLMSALDEIEVTNIQDGSSYYHEGYRYLEYDTRTNIYDVSIQAGQFKFSEGPSGDPQGKVFPGELNFLEVKQTFTLRWRSVPEDFVCDTTNFHLGYPRKLNSAAGRVNSKPFMGYPAGTLLMLESELDRYASGSLLSLPFEPPEGAPKEIERPFQMCDVIITLIHFDPPRFSQNNRGHNLKPWRRDTTNSFSSVQSWQFWRPDWTPPWAAQPPVLPARPEPQMLYYLVKFTKADGTVTETKVYGEYDFNKIFTHWSK